MAEFSKPGSIYNGAVPMLYSESISVNFNPDDKMVKTLLLGTAGFSDGASVAEFDVKGAIPIAGYEFDSAYYALNHISLTLTFVIAGMSTTGRGRITMSSTETTVDAPNSHSFKFTCAVTARNTL